MKNKTFILTLISMLLILGTAAIAIYSLRNDAIANGFTIALI